MLHTKCYRSVSVGVISNVRDAAQDARATVTLSAAVAVAALLVASVALVVAVRRS